MDGDELNCPICLQKFDLNANTPRILPNCGHTLCLSCIKKLIEDMKSDCIVRCPIDKQQYHLPDRSISKFPKNFSLTQLIGKALRPSMFKKEVVPAALSTKFCQIHSKECEFVCLDDKSLVCSDCGLLGSHRGHNIKKLSDVNDKIEKKVNLINELSEKIDEKEEFFRSDYLKLCERREERISKDVQIRFDEWIEALTLKKEKLLKEIKEHFTGLKEEFFENCCCDDTTNKELMEDVLNWRDEQKKQMTEYRDAINRLYLDQTNSTISNQISSQQQSQIGFDLLEQDVNKIVPRIYQWIFDVDNGHASKRFGEYIETICVTFDEEFLPSLRTFCEFNIGHSQKSRKTQLSLILDTSQMNMMTRSKKALESVEPKTILKENENFQQNLKISQFIYSFTTHNSKKFIEIKETSSKPKQFFSKLFSACGQSTKTMKQIKLKQLLYLDKLNIYVEKLSELGLSRLTKIFLAMPNLKKLTFHLQNGQGISDQCLQNFAEALPKFIHLKSLSFFLKDSNTITDTSLTKFHSSIKELKNLTKLSLNFDNCQKITESGIILISSLPSNIPELSKWQLSLTQNKHFKDSTLKSVSDHLAGLRNLKEVSFDFGGCIDLSNGGLEAFSDKISNMPNLLKVNIGFSGCEKITDEGLSFFFKSLKNLKNLQNLVINFSKCIKITGKSMIDLSQSILNKKKLIILDVNLAQTGITTENMSLLSNTICTLNNLETLCINLQECSSIGNPTLKELKKGIENLAHLSKLYINLEGCEKLTEQVFQYLFSALGKLYSLKIIQIYCCRTNIGNECIHSLNSALSGLNQIENIDLRFNDCKNLCSDAIEQLNLIATAKSKRGQARILSNMI